MTRRKQDKLIQYVYKLYHQQKKEHLTETNTNTTHKTNNQKKKTPKNKGEKN